jgi:hypothetical protein
MDSTFYTGVTPYMVGGLAKRFPRLKMHIFNFSDFPDSLAMRFISHGAKSHTSIAVTAPMNSGRR